ncbi:MAG: hypothetical protein ACI9TA_002773 [Reinekea sp.]|jgi:hypothetical protein
MSGTAGFRSVAANGSKSLQNRRSCLVQHWSRTAQNCHPVPIQMRRCSFRIAEILAQAQHFLVSNVAYAGQSDLRSTRTNGRFRQIDTATTPLGVMPASAPEFGELSPVKIALNVVSHRDDKAGS